MSGPKCLRCGAGSEWIQGKVPNDQPGPVEAWRDLLDILEQTLDRNPARHTPRAVSFKKAHALVVTAQRRVSVAQKEGK